jgi:hypothetical protein
MVWYVGLVLTCDLQLIKRLLVIWNGESTTYQKSAGFGLLGLQPDREGLLMLDHLAGCYKEAPEW